ncbi:hypothetical protein PTKIN_Ptkin05aG0058300 [Pterospermum kingtungense]
MSDNLSISDDSSVDHFEEMDFTDTIDYNNLPLDLPISPLFSSWSDYDVQSLLNTNNNQQNPVDEPTSACPADQLGSGLLPSSPPTNQLENFGLIQTNQLPSLPSCPNVAKGHENFSSLNYLEAKNEEDSAYRNVNENAAKYSQKNIITSNSFEGQGKALSMPKNSFWTEQMTKVCSTRDLENTRNIDHTNQRSVSTPWAMGVSPFKVGRCSPEERQEKIAKYRAKRNKRNFKKTIKALHEDEVEDEEVHVTRRKRNVYEQF